MSSAPTVSAVKEGGLRYASKTNGSPFATGLHGTMSCFLCGKHQVPASMMSKTLLGKPQKVCADKVACKTNRGLPATAKNVLPALA